MNMKLSIPALLMLCALSPVGSASADTLKLVTDPLGGAFEFASATANFAGKFGDVSAILGLGNGEFKVQHDPHHLHDAAPLPPTWTIMLTGLVGLGFMLSWSRRRRPDGVKGGVAVAT
jgi:hypothetical protein